MGTIWLRDLPTALQSLGNVTLFKGWETRCRSSGGYTSLKGIVVHHTASSTSTYNDTNYMWNNAPAKPVGAIYLARNGEIVVGAAGATNCAGRGGPYTTSKGVIALDTANSNTISIEAGNAGTGEPWPVEQQTAYVALVAALCKYYKFDAMRDVLAHFEWAPTRKIDPAGSSRYAAGGNKWNMGRFRTDVQTKMGGTTPPPTTTPPPYVPPPVSKTKPKGSLVNAAVMKFGGTASANWGGWFSPDGVRRYAVRDMNHAALLTAQGAVDAVTRAKVTSTSWSGVSHTTSQAEIDKRLGPPG